MTTATAPSPTSTAPTPHQVWKRARGLLIALLILVIAGITFAAVRSGTNYGHLDPRSADPKGSRAAAELLKARGISVTVATTLDEATTAAGPDTTLLVTGPNLLTPTQQRRLQEATTAATGRTVLIAPGPAAASRLSPGVRTEPHRPVSPLPPSCAFPAARSAGTADLGGVRYTAPGSTATACYPSDGAPSLLVLQDRGDGDTVLLGSPDFLHNERLDQQGNASLALQLLGSRPHLVWYLPSLADPSATSDDGSPRTTTTPTVAATARRLRARRATSSTWSPPAGSGERSNSRSPQCSPRSGEAAAWAPSSWKGCRSPSAHRSPPKAAPASTGRPTPVTGQPNHSGPPPGPASPASPASPPARRTPPTFSSLPCPPAPPPQATT